MNAKALGSPLGRDPLALVVMGCVVLGALMLGWMAASVNKRAACIKAETFLFSLCEPSEEERAQSLRNRITRNAGDTTAFRLLALEDRSNDHNRLVEVALTLAPSQPQLLVHKAAAALDRNDVKAAIDPLVTVVDNHEFPIAAQALAQIVASGQGGLLEPYLKPGSRWLPRVLAQMQAGQSSITPALPLVALALKRGVIDTGTVRKYVRELRAAKAWGDAYGLWLALLGKPVPALYNGDFDLPFDADGFDWEVPLAGPSRRAGIIVDRRGVEGRNAVLDMQFTGRPMAMPILRQHLFIGSGRYRLRGEHMARQFRAESGLIWTVHCNSTLTARSPVLADTGGNWRTFDFQFELPASCGIVATLQLETATRAEATLGARGRMAVDALTLERVP